MWHLKYDTNESIYGNRNRLTNIKHKLLVAKGGGGEVEGGMEWKLGLADVSYCI